MYQRRGKSTSQTALTVSSFIASLVAVTAQSSTTSPGPIFTIQPVQPSPDAGAQLIPNILDPLAINSQDVCPGYKASNVARTPYGLTANLNLADKACNTYGTDIDALSLTVEYQSSDRLHVEISPTYIDQSNSTWFILPEELVPKPGVDSDANTTILDNDLEFSWSNDPTFSFTVIRRSTGDTLFSTAGTNLVYQNQFIEFVSALPENYNLYGLGETIHGFRLGNNYTKTFWAADAGDPIDYNIYGTHAFYLDTRYYDVDSTTGNLTFVANATNATGNYVSYSHGVFHRNAHGQEVLLQPSNITWRALGGSVDLYFYAGPTQEQITRSYTTSTVGLPAMQQYFTFGYHQCRWGYQNWSVVQDVIDNFAKFGIPLENIWTDIDYMKEYRDFENDPHTFNYTETATFLSQIHENGQHYIPIVDSAIYIPDPANASDTYPTFDRGDDVDAFIMNPDGSLYVGQVWPGFTVFPDWVGSVLNGTGAFDWWKGEMGLWHQNVSFDGIWIDMSEVSSFCTGSCGSPNRTNSLKKRQQELYGYPEGFKNTNASDYAAVSASYVASSISASESSATAGLLTTSTATTTSFLRTTPTAGVRDVNHPPYVINNIQGDISVHAISPNATHHGGFEEYDFHNLFGHQILNATYHALLNIFPTKRPFIIGRSTFAGSGKWAGHWGGDNTSLWAYMFFSIPQALSFSLFGIPMFGVDTCGFNGNTDEELCNRWMQLSAFFPFYRNHNTIGALSQEPYRWASVIEASKVAMNIRYSLLPYIYTTFYLAHSTGSTVMRALPWEFPNEPLLAAVDNQFMLGDSILVTPVLAQGATTVDGVFPGVGAGEIWYDWYNQTAVSPSPGQNTTIDAPLGHIPVYVRGGSVLPIQEPGLTTRDSRSNQWGIIAATSLEGTASGQLYVDDGESLVQNSTLWVDFSLTNSALYASGRGLYEDTNPLANVTIMGIPSAVNSVTFNGAVITSGWTYNSTSKVLDIKGLSDSTSDGAWSQDWILKWT